MRLSPVQLAQRIKRALAFTEIERSEAVPQEDIHPPIDDADDSAEKGVTTRSESLSKWEDPETWENPEAGA